MNTNTRTLLVFLSVLSGLFFLIAGLGFAWPAWSWGLLALTVVCLALAVAGPAGARSDAGHLGTLPEPDVPVPSQPAYREHRIENVALPSATPDYDFVFSATVRWYPLETAPAACGVHLGALAADAVVTRARRFAAQEPAARYTLAQQHLNGALADAYRDPTEQVVAMARDVILTLHEEDRARLEQLAKVRKDEEVWQQKLTAERSLRAYLGDDVLKDPGSAVVWRLATNGKDVHDTVNVIGLLAQLSAAANNQEVPEVFRSFVEHPEPPFPGPDPTDHAERPHATSSWGAHPTSAGLAIALLEMLRADGRSEWPMLVERIASALDKAGYPDDAAEVRERFAPPEGDAPEADGGAAEG